MTAAVVLVVVATAATAVGGGVPDTPVPEADGVETGVRGTAVTGAVGDGPRTPVVGVTRVAGGMVVADEAPGRPSKSSVTHIVPPLPTATPMPVTL